MENENGPFKVYEKIANGLGIPKKDLVKYISCSITGRSSQKDEWGINKPRFIIDGINFYQDEMPQLVYFSKKNLKNGLELRSGENLDIDGKKLDGSIKSLREISYPYHFFSLVGDGVVHMEVRNEVIDKANVYKLNCPEVLFKEGIYYGPALEWMVKEWAGKNV